MPNTRITSFECEYNLINYVARDEASFSGLNIKSFCDVDTLLDTPNNYSYMTLEHNYSLLDGSFNEFPNNFITPYFSESMSDENGLYDNNPKLTISFDTPQNMLGLTFNFEKEYPLEISIKWQNENEAIFIETLNPDNKNYVAQLELISCVNIEIEFIKTLPNHYVKLVGLNLGQMFKWTENEIYSGNLLLENDAIADKISVNELNFSIIDNQGQYNLANDSGLHNYFQKNQEANAYEWVNGNKVYLGTYFLNDFSYSDNLASLKCSSYMGLLDKVNYNDGEIYNGTLAGTIIEDIFDKAGIESYLIDTTTANTPVYGTLKPGTCREALREILFACESVIDTTDEDYGVRVDKVNNIINDTIHRSEKISTKITKKEYTYGVEVEYPTYSLLNESEEIVNQIYPAGENTVVFNEAYANVIIKDSNDNVITPSTLKTYYCVFSLGEDTEITISGNRYEETYSKIQVTNAYVESGEQQNITSYSTTLCNARTAKTKAKSILNYLKYRLELDIQAISNNISRDGRKWVENPNENYANFIAWYQSRSLNLTGGFIDNAKLVGYYYNDYNYYYAGSELYAGEDVGVI